MGFTYAETLPYFSSPSEGPELSLLYTIWIFEDLPKKLTFVLMLAVVVAGLKRNVCLWDVHILSETHHMIWINAVVTRKNCQNWDPVLSCPCKPGITENSLLFWQDTICYLSEEEQWCAPSSPSSPPLFLLFLTAWLLDHLKLLSLSGHWRPGRDTPVIFSCIPKHFPVISNYSFWPPDNGGDSTLGQIRCKE